MTNCNLVEVNKKGLKAHKFKCLSKIQLWGVQSIFFYLETALRKIKCSLIWLKGADN